MFFIYKNENSKNFNIKINKINNLNTPQVKFEQIDIPGKNGSIIYSDGKFEDFLLEVECSLDGRLNDINELSRNIKKWLCTGLDYNKLIISNDPEYYYEACFCNKLDFEYVARKYRHFLIYFLCKPFKRSIYGDISINITTPICLYNDYLTSNPIIKVIGNGDITININNQKLILKGVEEYIEVDTELYNCFKGSENQNNKMYSDFPVLEEGKNNISWEGNVTRVEIIPRWVVL